MILLFQWGSKSAVHFSFLKVDMRVLICLAVVVVLTGCAAQVVSSSPRTVVIQAGSAQVAEAQSAADTECAKNKLFARLASKPTPNQFIYDCVP